MRFARACGQQQASLKHYCSISDEALATPPPSKLTLRCSCRAPSQAPVQRYLP